MSFFDDLASLCARELASARQAKTPLEAAERRADVVEGLSTMLGRSIYVAAECNPKLVDALLTGCEANVASAAAESAALHVFASSAKFRDRPQ